MSRRIRQVRREFWSDSLVGRWPDTLRLFYIGLWCVADDDGYLEWDAPAIGADLYRFQGTASRERDVTKRLDLLVDAGRLLRLPCGRHGYLPKLTEHQVISGRPNREVHNDHQRACLDALAGHGRPGPAMAVGIGRVQVGNGEERNGISSGAGAREAPGPRATMPRPGSAEWVALGETLAANARAATTRRRR